MRARTWQWVRRAKKKFGLVASLARPGGNLTGVIFSAAS